MNAVRVTTRGPDETLAVGRALAEALSPGDVVLLGGDLGAGKTVFTRGVARGLGIADPVVSPTFTIVREYAGRIPLVHVDVYRVETVRELHDLGFDEVVREDAVTVIEWGDLVASMFPERLDIRLALVSDDIREIEVAVRGASWVVRAPALGARVTDAMAASGRGQTC
jgi:tRNA threonylcarbamoyladenosine biosynthesis protein TsaE